MVLNYEFFWVCGRMSINVWYDNWLLKWLMCYFKVDWKIFIFDIGVFIGLEGVGVFIEKFLFVKGVWVICVELFIVGVCGLWFMDDDFFLEGDNNDFVFCIVGVCDVVLIVNLEFLDGELLEFFESGIFVDVFCWWVFGFEESMVVFLCEGVIGLEICWKEFCFFCFGEYGVEWLIWGVGKEWELDEFFLCVKGDIGRVNGCGFLEENDLLLEGGFFSFWFWGGLNKFCKDEGIDIGWFGLGGIGLLV